MLVFRFAMQASESITLALHDMARGDKSAMERLLPLVYTELRKRAGFYFRQERKDHTLQPTALVHEAYFRLIEPNQPDFAGRSHFFGVAAHVMRQILIDHARSRNALKRGSGEIVFSLNESIDASAEPDVTAIRVDDALQALEAHDALKGKLIEMRFFGGMTAEESAEVMGLPVQKVRSELRVAQAWLRRELDQQASPGK